MTIYNILEDLANDSSRLAKEQILRDNVDNNLLKRVFDAALNPYRVFGIKKIPTVSPLESRLRPLEDALLELTRFETRELTGNAAIAQLTRLLESVSEGDAIVLERIIKKDLRCGVQASTVNKIWPGLIPTFPCLLAKVYDDSTADNITWPAIAQLKADGMRAMAWLEDGVVQIRGRSGKPIEFNGILENRIRPLLETVDGVLDGELVVVESNGDIMPRKKGNGILNSFIRPSSKIEKLEADVEKEKQKINNLADMVRFRVWDLIDFRAFKTGHDVMPYRLRLGMLKRYIDLQPSNYYEVIEGKEVDDIDQAREYFAQALAQGEEGIMLKDMESPWEDKRSKYVLKFKSELECDLEVIGWNTGTPGTKNENKVGSLICATIDRKVEVSISGFSDELRNEITHDINDWIGRIVTVRYNERIASKEKGREDKDSLFLPRFLELREDKDTADSSEKVL